MVDYIYTPPNLTGGIDDAFLDVVTEVPAFIPSFLFFIWFVIFLGGSMSQKRKLGSADMPMWATIASMGTLLVTLPLTLLAGLISLNYLSIIVVVTIFSGLWLFLDRNRNEA